MKIAAVMATRFFPPKMEPLLRGLTHDGVIPVVVPDVHEHGPDWSLYGLWNAGLDVALALGVDYIAVMNDDVALCPGTCEALASVLHEHPEVGIAYPDVTRPIEAGLAPHGLTPTRGTWGADGMTGFCFMFRTSLLRLGLSFDTSYRWWYGDDDFEERVRLAGLDVVRVDGVPVWHVPGQSAARLPGLQALIEADRALWDARHAVGRLGPSTGPVGAADVAGEIRA